MQQFVECSITMGSLTRLNRGKDYYLSIDGVPMFTGTKSNIEGVLDFLEHGFYTKKLNSSEKNQVLKTISSDPSLRLFGCHPCTGEPLSDDEPVRRGHLYPYGGTSTQLMRIINN